MTIVFGIFALLALVAFSRHASIRSVFDMISAAAWCAAWIVIAMWWSGRL